MIRYSRLACSAMLFVTSFAFGAAFPTGTFVIAGGQATVRFGADGRFHVAAGSDSVDGTYSATGDQITLTDVSGTMACADTMKVGQYKWSYADNAITFTKVKDVCDERSGDLTAQPWKKQ
jgi:META domain